MFLCVSDFVEMVNWVGSAKTLHTVSERERERKRDGGIFGISRFGSMLGHMGWAF